MITIKSKYKNGNYNVVLLTDGTKIRYKEDDGEFDAEFPENIDLKITDRCDIGCPFCYEDSKNDGEHGVKNFNHPFFDTLTSGTELAIGGGGITSLINNSETRKEFLLFLLKLNSLGVVPNVTINQLEIEAIAKHKDKHIVEALNIMIDEIYGLGVSFKYPSKMLERLLKICNNLVIHTIVGITSEEDYKWLVKNGFKILILGYKEKGRGVEFKNTSPELEKNTEWLYNNLGWLLEEAELVSFDNLALEQLNIKRFISDEEFEEMYMGDDGTATMYIDLVKGTFSKNSIAPESERLPLMNNINEMFKIVKENKKKEGLNGRVFN